MNEFEDMIFPFPARVLRVEQTRSPELMMLAANSNAFDPTIFTEKTPFFWTAEISNSGVDAYHTKMLPSTLANFVTDARAGVGFLNSHRHNELPLGRSVDARMEDTGDRQRVLADFFTLPGLNLNGLATDEFIAGVRSGIVSDISVGFFSGKHFCSICQMNYLSYDCPHMAGMEYQIQGGGMTLCTVGIDGAHLAEVSAVYDGATPDATILKAQRMVEAGELKPEAVRTLEARYRMKFDNKRSFAGVSVPERKKVMEFEQIVNQIREVLAIDSATDVVGTVLTTSTELLRLRTVSDQATKELATLQERVKVLTPQAEDGATYRNDLVAEALAEGVRALGDKFTPATYEPLLRTAPLSVIKQMRADWAVVGNAQFVGGRQTTDEGTPAPGNQVGKRQLVPSAAYRA